MLAQQEHYEHHEQGEKAGDFTDRLDDADMFAAEFDYPDCEIVEECAPALQPDRRGGREHHQEAVHRVAEQRFPIGHASAFPVLKER